VPRKILILLFFTTAVISTAASPNTTTIPHPFFFTENKGQWDARVLYKCNARNGMTWFLERDGITLLTMKEDKSKEPATSAVTKISAVLSPSPGFPPTKRWKHGPNIGWRLSKAVSRNTGKN